MELNELPRNVKVKNNETQNFKKDRETERQRDRETERQRDRETERQRDRETERQTAICFVTASDC